jgi:hypothetical protein
MDSRVFFDSYDVKYASQLSSVPEAYLEHLTRYVNIGTSEVTHDICQAYLTLDESGDI